MAVNDNFSGIMTLTKLCMYCRSKILGTMGMVAKLND